jgi:hypothetical protein
VFLLMNPLGNSDTGCFRTWWRGVMKLTGRGEPVGWSIGAALFRIELALSGVCRE